MKVKGLVEKLFPPEGKDKAISDCSWSEDSYDDEYGDSNRLRRHRQFGGWRGEPMNPEEEERQRRKELEELVKNIDDISGRAAHMTVTKNLYVDCLRALNKKRVLDVRDAK